MIVRIYVLFWQLLLCQIRNEEVNQNRCPVSDKPEAKFSQCQVVVWEKPWQNYLAVINDECTVVSREEAMGTAK